jgi:hypothetical protein
MNTLHYYSDTWEKESDGHSVVGYDPYSEQIEFTLTVPKSKKSLVRQFVQFGGDDPKGYDSYKLSYRKASELVHLLGGHKPPKKLEYFVEYHVPQQETVRQSRKR